MTSEKLSRRLWHLVREPGRFGKRIIEWRLRWQADRSKRSRTQAQNDLERAAVFQLYGDINPLFCEARRFAPFQELAAIRSAPHSRYRAVIASQTISLDDCITMYVLVRLIQPEIMVETSVFYRALSAMILSAMDRNGRGKLISIDLPCEGDGLPAHMRGAMVPPALQVRWQLILGDSRIELPSVLASSPRIDAFNHDSLHTTDHMTWEYETAWKRIQPRGLLSSHDVMTTPSWSQFVHSRTTEIALYGHVYGLGVTVKAHISDDSSMSVLSRCDS